MHPDENLYSQNTKTYNEPINFKRTRSFVPNENYVVFGTDKNLGKLSSYQEFTKSLVE